MIIALILSRLNRRNRQRSDMQAPFTASTRDRK